MSGIGNADIELFAAKVLSRLGFCVDQHSAPHIVEVLRRRLELAGCKTVAAYVGRFAGPAFAQGELSELARALTVPETYFFRHPEQFQALAGAALPARMEARKTRRQLSVLSAGCASGEEAYSLAAVILKVSGIENWDVRIQGVDLNRDLVEKARRGRYSDWSLRAVGEAERRLCFRREGSEYALNERLKSAVTFEEGNLAGEGAQFWRPGFFDIIFCRNVMIYFSPMAVRTLASRLALSLAPGGFLFLGPSETLRGISQEFHLRHTHGAFYYQRRETPASAPGRVSASAWPLSAEGEVPSSASSPEAQVGGQPGWASAIEASRHRVAALAEQSRPRPPEKGGGKSLEREQPMPAVLPAGRELAGVLELLREERFEDALRAMDALPGQAAADPDALMVQAVLLTNRGELRRAEEVCARLLASDDLRPGGHYLMAICQEKRGDPSAATEHDLASIYLDEAFAMPHLHLGLLAKGSGDLATARRELGRALVLLAREDASRILLFGGGFSREALTRFCHAQLERCGGGL
jgi:chemotaxis protein methyltransferase CheR